MPAIDRVMQRLGFVRLAQYGLVLTPEARIMSLRPTVGGEALGARIVGWRDGDPIELALARPAPVRAVATAVAIPSTAAVRPTPAAQPAPVLAQDAELEEDAWEWHIALARARIVADEADQHAQRQRMAARVRDTMPALRAMPVLPPLARSPARMPRPVVAPVMPLRPLRALGTGTPATGTPPSLARLAATGTPPSLARPALPPLPRLTASH